jgi:hypothetical protein
MSRTKPAAFKRRHPTIANKRRKFACDDEVMAFKQAEPPKPSPKSRRPIIRPEMVYHDTYEQMIQFLLVTMRLDNSNQLPHPLPPDMVRLIREMEEGS